MRIYVVSDTDQSNDYVAHVRAHSAEDAALQYIDQLDERIFPYQLKCSVSGAEYIVRVSQVVTATVVA